MSQQSIYRVLALPCLRPKNHLLSVICLVGLAVLGTGDLVQAQAQTQSARRAALPPKPVCLVADFRTLALQTHDPKERATETRNWLRANGAACTAAQLGVLASNRAAWLGNADSPALMGTIDGMIETLEAKQLASASAAATTTQAKAALNASNASNAPATDTVTAGTPPPRTAAAPNGQTPAAPTIAPVVVPVTVPTPVPASPPRP